MPHSLRGCLEPGREEAGVDEAGRGCLAGPVVAAAVILPPGFSHPLLNDSKQLPEKTRNLLRGIIESSAMAWGVGMATPAEIDEINILQASILAMHRAIHQLTRTPAHLLVDGNRFYNRTGIPHTCLVKGDATFLSIAAASVLAKTHRDEMMLRLHDEFPGYGWNANKGYPTAAHRAAIRELGITPYHRQSFRLTHDQLSLWDTLPR
ncbi:MAG TPA: ribonuclease HII [Prolixibacteraceae bacterium]|nr:ribonuclease HII [Prolixibacteraceae bacterium]HRV90341.1 ribonuclease HII [Prolixibacteraceae bacterium]